MINAMHFNVQSPIVTSDLDKIVTAWSTLWGPGMRTMVSQAITQPEVRFYELPLSPGILGDPIYVRTDVGVVGTGVETSTLPPQCAITVTFQTAPRRHWGRIYLGGIVHEVNSDGRIASNTVNTIGGAFHTFLATLLTQNTGLFIFDRKAWAGNAVTAVSVDDIWDVQRRRRYDHPVTRFQQSVP